MTAAGRRDAAVPSGTECWLDPRITTGTSSIEGTGLFTTAVIPAGVVVVRMGGRLVSSAELQELLNRSAGGGGYVDTIVVAADRHLVLPPGQAVHYGNHSCDPNLWWAGPYTLVSRRPIPAGQEVTNDYATSTGSETWAMPCACRSPLCRGVVRGSDWRRQELRERYGDHWVPALVARIRETAAG
jgi:uncharacterized protein